MSVTTFFDDKIVSVTPVIYGDGMKPPTKVLPAKDCFRNASWYLHSLGLTECGRLLPILWDGAFTFEAYDPIHEQLVRFSRQLVPTEQPQPSYDPERDPEYEKKMEAIKRINGEKESQDDGAEQS